MNSKYFIRNLSEDEVLAALGIFTERDLEYLKQTLLYRHWKRIGKLEISEKPMEGSEN